MSGGTLAGCCWETIFGVDESMHVTNWGAARGMLKTEQRNTLTSKW